MSSLIQKITKLAVQKFNRDQMKSKRINIHLDQIKSLVNKITLSELNMDPHLLQDTGPFDPQKDNAPVTYMQIYEDADVTICVFILKNGARLPLHDHPEMNGILKVIHGEVYVQSYTLLDEKTPVKQSCSSSTSFHSAIKHPSVRLSANDPACSLNPRTENLHEIRSSGGPAAFLDILSPPYGVDHRNGYERDCHYYEQVQLSSNSSLESNKVLLMNIPTPRDFWCDQAQYMGPPLNNLGDDPQTVD